jgi:hypothetical protein
LIYGYGVGVAAMKPANDNPRSDPDLTSVEREADLDTDPRFVDPAVRVQFVDRVV